MPNVPEVIEKEGNRFRVVELPIDPPMTVKRFLVPVDTTDAEVPVGARLLSEAESKGHLSKSSAPERIQRGDPVRLREDTNKVGNVVAILKSGKVTVKWDGGLQERIEPEKLMKIY